MWHYHWPNGTLAPGFNENNFKENFRINMVSEEVGGWMKDGEDK